MNDIHSILKQYWGYDKFRPLQEDIIQSVLDKKDTLALLPTGGGKSICFQVPAMAMDGVCIVISPLVALMKDQVDNLVKRNIKAVAVTSAMHRREIDIAFDNCIYGNTKFLYLSPERLATELAIVRISKMKVCMIAVDEAHCISQWGYDFRPAYLNINKCRELHPEVPVLALTATATQEVVEDIQDKLEFRQRNALQKSFERKNLAYVVRETASKEQELLKIITRTSGSTVVYVRSRKKTREVSEWLVKNKITSTFYHAGLTTDERNYTQKLWMDNKCRVMVATNAFGMGIDKPDVRVVVHMDVPDNPEAYFQEAGRAGRDEQKAYAVLLVNKKTDVKDLENNLITSFPSLEDIKRVYQALANFFQVPIGAGDDVAYAFDINAFVVHYNLDPILVHNSLRLLEKESYVTYLESYYQPARCMVLLSPRDLYNYQLQQPKLDSFIKNLLRAYGAIYNDYVKINEFQIAKLNGLRPEEVTKRLKFLHDHKIISYLPQTNLPQVLFTHGRVDAGKINLSPENYNNRKIIASRRTGAMIDYFTQNDFCRSRVLLKYFGQTQTNDCRQCDVCLTKAKEEQHAKDVLNIEDEIISLLKMGPTTLPGLLEKLRHEENIAIDAINWLIEEDIIRKEGDLLSYKKN